MAKMLLVKEDDNTVFISIYYQAKKNKFGTVMYKILTEEEGKKAIEKKDASVDVLNTKWAVPTWKITTNIVRSSTYYNPADGTQRLDPTKYRDNIFRACLKEWDITDEAGVPIPLNADSIGQLPNVVAEELLRKYDQSTESDEIDEKKLQKQP